MRIRLVMLGKTRRTELRALLEDYAARIRHHADLEIVELRKAPAPHRSGRALEFAAGATLVLLDVAGKTHDSESFARWLAGLRDSGTRELVFLCGDAEGFPEELRRRAALKLSLTPLTLSHELARVVLAEQLYRAFAILSGSPYPK